MKHKKTASLILRQLLLIGLFLTPFIFWPWMRVAFEIPKVWITNRWIELLGIFAIVLYPYVSQKEKNDKVLILLVVAFLILTFISSILGENFSKSFWGNYYRSDGLYTFLHIVIFYFFIILMLRKDWIPISLKVISTTSVLLSSLSLVLAILKNVFGIDAVYMWNWEGAFGGPFGNPNFLAGYLLTTLPFTFYAIGKKAKGFWLFPVLQIIAILLTKTWSGIFGTLLFFIIFILIKKPMKWVVPVLLGVIIVVLGIIFYKSNPAISYDNSQVAESRQRIFTKGFMAFQERPILGWGWANFDYAFDSVVWPIKFSHDVYVDKAHSHLLEVLVTTGILGFSVYVFLLARTLYNFLKLKLEFKKYLFLSVVLFIIHSQTNIISISEELIFWFLAGIASKRS